jgi:hypothetical protein
MFRHTACVLQHKHVSYSARFTRVEIESNLRRRSDGLACIVSSIPVDFHTEFVDITISPRRRIFVYHLLCSSVGTEGFFSCGPLLFITTNLNLHNPPPSPSIPFPDPVSFICSVCWATLFASYLRFLIQAVPLLLRFYFAERSQVDLCCFLRLSLY